MSYLALARKWRPRSFDEVVGQEHVVSVLTSALDNDRVHHAFLVHWHPRRRQNDPCPFAGQSAEL